MNIFRGLVLINDWAVSPSVFLLFFTDLSIYLSVCLSVCLSSYIHYITLHYFTLQYIRLHYMQEAGRALCHMDLKPYSSDHEASS
jgi:hypothetical protein